MDRIMYRRLFILFTTAIIISGCGNSKESAKTGTPDAATTPIPQDSEVSLANTSASLSGTNGAYTLTYTDAESGLETSATLRYGEVYANQITVIYTGEAPEGVVYQSGLEGELKIGLFTSGATSADTYATDLARLNGLAGIILAEPNYRVSTGEVVTAAYVNDPEYTAQWGLQTIGIETAWAKTTGSSDIVVAVIDTGIDYTHKELAANIWHNSNEIAANGIDDDGNGLVDDAMGYDFVNRDTEPMDDNRHGTHCAGIIGARSNNTIGIAGISPDVSLMPLKVLGADGSGSSLNIFYGFKYAVENGARVISMSLGGYGFNYLSYYGAYYAYKNNVLVVAAAGNEANDNDANPVYPASFPFSNIISVAASDSGDALAAFSNYGAQSVDIAAPGVNILSTVPGDGYTYLSGTSMATPFVSGAAALVLAMDDSLTHIKTREYILREATALAALEGKVYTGARLNAGSLLEADELQQILSVVSLVPDADATDVATDSKIRIYFNRPLDETTLSTDSIVVKESNGRVVAGTFSLNQTIVIFTPDGPLAGDATYSVTLKQSLASTDGSAMESEYTYHFTTEAGTTDASTGLPEEDGLNDLDAATDVSIHATVSFTFDAPLTVSQIMEIEFLMKGSSGEIIAGKLAYGYSVLTFTPSEALKPNTRYQVSLAIASLGIAENFTFTTASQ